MAKASTLSDDFNGGSINGTKWTPSSGNSGSYAQTGGQLVLTPASSTLHSYVFFSSANTYDLTSSAIYVQVNQVSATGIDNQIEIPLLQTDDSNALIMDCRDGNLNANYMVGGSATTVASIAYNSTTMKWWRIRESGGTSYWDYSANGVTWTNFGSVANPITLTTVYLWMSIWEGVSTASPLATQFDNFNFSLWIPPAVFQPLIGNDVQIV